MRKKLMALLGIVTLTAGSIWIYDLVRNQSSVMQLSMQLIGEYPDTKLERLLPEYRPGPHKYGFIDKKGALKIEARFDDAGDFHEGLAAVRIGNRWGFVTTDGTIAIQPQFHRARNFTHGLAAVKSGKYWGFINKHGKFVINPQFIQAEDFAGKNAQVSDWIHHGLIDRTGKLLLPVKAKSIGAFQNGLARVEMDDKVGFIKEDGTWLCKPEFEDGGDFSEGLAAVSRNNLWGYIDETGAMVVEQKFKHAATFFDGVASVETEKGHSGLIDKNGNFVVKPTFNGFARMLKPAWREPSPISTNGLTPFLEHEKGWGFASNEDGQPVIEPSFMEVSPFSEGMACVAIKEKVERPTENFSD